MYSIGIHFYIMVCSFCVTVTVPSSLMSGLRFRPDGEQQHLFYNNFISVRVKILITVTDEDTILLLKVVFGIPDVKDL